MSGEDQSFILYTVELLGATVQDFFFPWKGLEDTKCFHLSYPTETSRKAAAKRGPRTRRGIDQHRTVMFGVTLSVPELGLRRNHLLTATQMG